MKKKTITSLLVGSIVLTIATFGLIHKPTSITRVDASDDPAFNPGYHSTGFYEKITDKSDLEDGDSILLVDVSNKNIFSHLGGNPAYAGYAEDEDNHFTDDNRYIGLSDSIACEFKLIKVNDGTSYYYHFRGSMTMDWSGVHDVVLAYCPEDHSEFDSIGQFTGDHLGARKYNSNNLKDEKTRWTILDSGSSGNNFNIVSRVSGGPVRSFAIYRKYGITTSFGCDYYSLDYQNYYVGDTLNLHGLIFNVYDNNIGETFEYKYENNSGLFYLDNYTVAPNTTEYNLKIVGLPNRSFEFGINEPTESENYFYTNSNITQLKDYRGTYLAAAEVSNQSSNNLYLPARFITYNRYDISNVNTCYMDHGNIPVSQHILLDDAITIERVKYQGEYHYVAKNKDDKYFNNREYENHQLDWSDIEFIDFTDTISPSNFIEIREKNNNLTLLFKSMYDDEIPLRCDTYYKTMYFDTIPDTSENCRDAYLYKLSTTHDTAYDITSFMSKFYQNTQNCDATGNAQTVFSHHWEYLETEFNLLSADAKGYFTNLTYTHNAESYNTPEDVVDRYDFLIGKYSDDLWDFMGRKSANTYQGPSLNNSIMNNIITNMDASTMLIVVLMIVVISSGALFVVLLRKKRQH